MLKQADAVDASIAKGEDPGVLAGVPPRSQLALFRMVDPRLVRIGVVHGPDLAPEVIDELQKAEKAN